MAFTKSNKLDNVLYDVRGPVVDEAAGKLRSFFATYRQG